MRTIQLQPEEQNGGTLPYPYYIDPETFEVGRQDIWRGSPYRLLGFNDTRETGNIELEVTEWIENPESAVGMFPVFENRKGGIFTYQLPVMSVSDMNV